MKPIIQINPFSMKSLLMAILLFSAPLTQAQELSSTGTASVSEPYLVTRWILIGLAAILLIIVAVAVHSAMIAAKHNIKSKQTEDKTSSVNQWTNGILILIGMMLASVCSAQSTATAAVSVTSIPLDIYVLVLVILLEFLILLFLIRSVFLFLGIQKIKKSRVEENKPSLFTRLNQTVALEDEMQLDLKHNYDGIRELDNKTPGWWTYAFYFTIAFGVIYLYRMFVSGSLPSQITELKVDYEKAAVLKAEYLRVSANNVDENTVVMMGPEEIAKGAMTFKANCAVCHGEKGEGNTVGPNLTDEYWLHKGGIKDVFYTIKYGFPEKGMKSWAADFSPVQIAQLASFIKSLQGTHPLNAKEKQGERYTESDPAPRDSILVEK